ncbi:MAG: hypothetical protein QXD98_02880 [Candidatus Diapherotrites archaeon]
MQKAQISLDLALAIIVATIFISAIAITTSNLEKNTEEIAKNNSAKQMLITFYSAILAVKAYDVNIDLKFNTPLANNSQSTIKECKIIIDNQTKDMNVIIDKIQQGYSGINFTDLYIDFENETGATYWENGYANNPTTAEIQCGKLVKIKEKGPI